MCEVKHDCNLQLLISIFVWPTFPKVADTSVEYGCNTNSASAITDASPEISVVGKKRKASHRKEASKKKKKRKLLASAAKGDEVSFTQTVPLM